jgi:hypothetical protein
VLFPVGLGGLVLGVLPTLLSWFHTRPRKSTTLPVKTREALDRLKSADRERDRRLIELEAQHRARLQALSVKEQEELEQLRGAPLEDVVRWFDSL